MKKYKIYTKSRAIFVEQVVQRLWRHSFKVSAWS